MKKGYCNGSDMLVYINDRAIGHCTSHKTSMKSDTRDRAVKPHRGTLQTSLGLWKNKGVTGLSISISADGLVFYDETEAGYKELLAAWKTAKPVTCKCMARGDSETPYMTGRFVIESLERTDPANEDSTYSISLVNSGEVECLPEGGGDTPTPGQVINDALLLRGSGYIKLRNGKYLKLHLKK